MSRHRSQCRPWGAAARGVRDPGFRLPRENSVFDWIHLILGPHSEPPASVTDSMRAIVVHQTSATSVRYAKWSPRPQTGNLWRDTVPRAALIYGHFGSRLTSRQRGSEMTIVDFATKDECDLHLLLGTLLTACPGRGLYLSTNGKLRHCQCWWTYWLTKFAFLWSRRTTGPVCPCDWTPALKINNLGVIHIWRVGSYWHYVCHI